METLISRKRCYWLLTYETKQISSKCPGDLGVLETSSSGSNFFTSSGVQVGTRLNLMYFRHVLLGLRKVVVIVSSVFWNAHPTTRVRQDQSFFFFSSVTLRVPPLYLSNGCSNPKNSKNEVHLFSDFGCGRTLPTQSTGPQPIQLVPKIRFLQISQQRSLKSKKK